MFNSLKSKLQFVELENPRYIYLQIIPSTSIRNYNTDNIIKVIASLYRSFRQRVNRVNLKFYIEAPAKVAFYIYMEKHSDFNNVMFYFIVPEPHYRLFKDKLIDAWRNKVTINIVDKIPIFSQDCTKYYMTYMNEDALSLVTDKRDNHLLASEVSCLHVMEEGDKAGIFYNFIPRDQKTWSAEYDEVMTRLKENKSIVKYKLGSLGYYVETIINYVIKAFDIALGAVNIVAQDSQYKYQRVLSDNTKKKRVATVVDVQILCLSESNRYNDSNRKREKNIAQSLCRSFDCLSEDNELINKKYKGEHNFLDIQLKDYEPITMSHREEQNFISVAGDEIIKEHKLYPYKNITESPVPKSLRSGVIPLGTNEYKNETGVVAFLPTTDNGKNLCFVIVGANRTGKSTYLANLAYYAKKAGECVIVFDYCGECTLVDEISNSIKDVKIIDCENLDELQGMGYNEVQDIDTNINERYKSIKIQASQLVAMLNAVNDDDREMKNKMNRVLTASAMVVFLNGGSFEDVIAVLEDHKLRGEYIKSIPKEYDKLMRRFVNRLKGLDKLDKSGKVIGTVNNTTTEGIIDRIETLKGNMYMELMLMKDTKDNFNLIDEMQKSQVICFRMPDSMFTTDMETDAYCTYWMTKIWLALKFRMKYIPKEKRKKVNVIIDELYQVPRCQEYLKQQLSQMAKFNCKPIISCHHLEQIKPIRKELKSANSSFMLIAGCNKSNYYELEEELQPFTVEDLLALKEYQSLNLIKVADGYEKFVTDLPKPLWHRNRKELV